MGERLPLLSEGSLESETCVHPNVPFSSLPLRAQARHLSPCIPLGTPPPHSMSPTIPNLPWAPSLLPITNLSFPVCQYEQAADAELAWVAETKRKLMALGPIRLEQDQTTAQLQVQKVRARSVLRGGTTRGGQRRRDAVCLMSWGVKR